MAWNPLKSDNDSEKDPTQPDASAAAPQQEARILDATGVDPEAGQRPEASEVDDGEQVVIGDSSANQSSGMPRGARMF